MMLNRYERAADLLDWWPKPLRQWVEGQAEECGLAPLEFVALSTSKTYELCVVSREHQEEHGEAESKRVAISRILLKKWNYGLGVTAD